MLARLLEGDPLALAARCAARQRRVALLVDAERLFLRSAARIAHAASVYRGKPSLEAWLRARIDDALRDLVKEDRTCDASGAGALGTTDSRLIHLSTVLGIDLLHARRACIAFNVLSRRHRLALWSVLIEGRSVLEHARDANLEIAQVRGLVKEGVEALNRAAGLDGKRARDRTGLSTPWLDAGAETRLRTAATDQSGPPSDAPFESARDLRLESGTSDGAEDRPRAAGNHSFREHRALVADLLLAAGSARLRAEPTLSAAFTDYVGAGRLLLPADLVQASALARALLDRDEYRDPDCRRGLSAVVESASDTPALSIADMALLSLRLERRPRAMTIAALDLGRRGATRLAEELYEAVLQSPATDEDLTRACEGFAYLLARQGRLERALELTGRACETRQDFVLPRLNRLVLGALLGRREEMLAADRELREIIDDSSELLGQFVAQLASQRRAGLWTPSRASAALFRDVRALIGPCCRRVSDVFEEAF